MSTNDPIDDDRRQNVQHVHVHRVGEPDRKTVRRFRRKIVFTGVGGLLVAIVVVVLMLGLLIVALPYLLIVAAALMLFGAVQRLFTRR